MYKIFWIGDLKHCLSINIQANSERNAWKKFFNEGLFEKVTPSNIPLPDGQKYAIREIN